MTTSDTRDTAPPQNAPAAAPTGPARLALQLVRSFSQLTLQSNAAAGCLILIAIFVGSRQVGLFGLLGAVAALATAYALGVDRESLDLGVQGFSGCLTGMGLLVFLGDYPSTYLLAVGGAVVSVLLYAALSSVLAPWKLPVLTSAFCAVCGLVVAAAPAFTRAWHGGSPAALPVMAIPGARYTWTDLWHGFFANIAQVTLSAHWYVGLIILAGLFVAGIRQGLAAVLGSATAVMMAWAMGAPPGAVAVGVYGYNAVLVAIALGTLFLAPRASSMVYALIGVGAATVLTAAANAYFGPFGGRTLTWPFTLTTWVLLAAAPAFPRIRRAD